MTVAVQVVACVTLAGSYIYHDPRHGLHFLTAVDSAFHPPWDGKVIINFKLSYNKWRWWVWTRRHGRECYNELGELSVAVP